MDNNLIPETVEERKAHHFKVCQQLRNQVYAEHLAIPSRKEFAVGVGKAGGHIHMQEDEPLVALPDGSWVIEHAEDPLQVYSIVKLPVLCERSS
eukprot:CAMPEP_0177668290 /NCGR_PEP_ID=MMETSP0447-20121125/22671_1 /TAXON_ID=0 /ORGANISM="Stygamoeba regulata, Strain BSH-02190019" /LENGTH=93 /DNA_ID=CAMNT_0019174765 /DNA_START=25 /DNA_END=306 /DNA_ORIENTATION=+